MKNCTACNMDEGWPICLRDERCPCSPAPVPGSARGIEREARAPAGPSPKGEEPGGEATRPEAISPPEESLSGSVVAAQQPLTADMFWDADDYERCEHDIESIVTDYSVGAIVTIDQAMRLPQLKVRVIEGDDGENTWEPVDGIGTQEQQEGGSHE